MGNIIIGKDRESGENPLKQAHIVMLDLLKYVHSVCKDNGWEYWIDAGTLLGAKRHNGFIPWDDDLDICMPRKDYEAFYKYLNDNIHEEIHLQKKGLGAQDKWKWIKLRDKYSTFTQVSEEGCNIKYHQGIFVDIFPYDLVNEDITTKKLIFNKRLNKSSNAMLRTLGFFANHTVALLHHILGYNFIKNKLVSYYSREDFKYVTAGFEVMAGMHRFDKKTVFPLSTIKFEGFECSCPNDVDTYLTKMYGDYMTLPPVGQREVHACFIEPTKACGHKDTLDWQKTKNKK